MQEQITLSNAEKKHYFFYLLGMLLFAVALLGIIFLYNENSPFKNKSDELVDSSSLKTKGNYEKNMLKIIPTIDSTFANIKQIDTDKSERISIGDEVSLKIASINQFTTDNPSQDPRMQVYQHIIYFSRMFVDDKNQVITTRKKIVDIEDDIQECNSHNSTLNKQ